MIGAREADRRRAAGGELDAGVMVGSVNAAGARDDRHLAHLGHLRQAAGQPADDLVLVRDAAWRDRSSARRSSTPSVSKCATSSMHRGDVQQRLRRDAADVEADAAERRIALDQHDLEAEVGGAEGGRVAAGAGAEHEQVAARGRRRRTAPAATAGDARRARRRRGAAVPAPARAPGCRRRRGRGRLRGAAEAPARGAARRSAAAASSSVRITEPSLTVSPTLTLISLTTPACDDGISIDALSLSTVIRLCSTLTLSPGLTRTSMTPTSLKSPMSGTFDRRSAHSSTRRKSPRIWIEERVEARRRGAVDDAVVPAQRERQDQARLERLAVPDAARSCCGRRRGSRPRAR